MILQSKSLQSAEPSIETLLEEIKPVVTEEHEFKYRDESMLKALFGSFGLLGF